MNLSLMLFYLVTLINLPLYTSLKTSVMTLHLVQQMSLFYGLFYVFSNKVSYLFLLILMQRYLLLTYFQSIAQNALVNITVELIIVLLLLYLSLLLLSHWHKQEYGHP